MPFNIRDFRSDGLKLGGARPTLFSVILTPPAGIGLGSSTTKQLSLLTQSSQIPPANIEDISVYYHGRPIKVQGDRTFPDWTITVMNDEDFSLRSMFENWSNEMNAFVSNRSSFGQSALAYKVDALVEQYGKAGPNSDGGIIRSYKFVGLWPKTIGAINLDYSQTNTIETFDVTFAYDWWEPANFGAGETYKSTLSDDGAGS